MEKWVNCLQTTGGINLKYWQQGDVILEPVSFPDVLDTIKTNVLQEGEHTGHAHRLFGDGFTVFEEPKSKTKYLRVVKPVALRHEEHKEVKIPPGDYKIGLVREFDHWEQATRRVID